MDGNMGTRRTDIRISSGKGSRECDASELEFFRWSLQYDLCSYERLNAVRKRQEASLFYYSHLNVRTNVN